MTLRCWCLLTFALLLGAASVLGGRWWLAQRHFQTGTAALDRRALERARASLRDCLALRPNHAQARLLAARAARLAGDLDEAHTHLEHLRVQRPGDPEALLERTLLAVQAGSATSLDEVFLWERAGTDERDQAILVLECLAPSWLTSYRLAEARRALDRWLELEPDSIRALLLRASVHQGEGHTGEAEADLRAALQADPSSDEASIRLALFLLERDPQAAVNHLRPLLARRPADPDVVLGLARAQLELDSAEAVRLLDTWLQGHPQDAVALALRGKVEYGRQRWADAERHLKRALEIDPSDRDVAFQLHTCAARQGKPEEARKLKEQVERLDIDLENLRDWHRKAGERPFDPEPPFEAGRICLRNAQTAEALRWFGNALRRDRSHRATHRALVDHYERVGETARAAQHRAQAEER